MGDVGFGGASACGLDKDGNDRPGVPDHPWIGYGFRYLLLVVKEAPALPDFHHQPAYSSGGNPCRVDGWRTHFLADAACGAGGAWFGVVSIARGRANGAGGQ